MRHDAIEFAAASAIAKRRSGRSKRSERLRDASRMLAAGRSANIEIIDEAFARFTRVDAPAERDDKSATENLPDMTARLSDCLSAQLNALDRQRTQLVELLRCVDQESRAV